MALPLFGSPQGPSHRCLLNLSRRPGHRFRPFRPLLNIECWDSDQNGISQYSVLHIVLCTCVFLRYKCWWCLAATSAGPPTHGVDPKDSPGRGILDFYGNPSAASAIHVVESIHGAMDVALPFIGIKFQCLAKRDQTLVVWKNSCAKQYATHCK